MTLSVVVPALNEERHLGACLAALRREHGGELLVVDGGSRDLTVKVAGAAGARVLAGERGYARQANLGARAATGEVLFFLAADSRPEPGWLAALEAALATPAVVAGGFHLRLDDPAWPFRVIEWGGNFRARHRQLALPDQGLFVRRDAFFAAGAMPERSLIPHAWLCHALKEHGAFRLLPHRVASSTRKWKEHGLLRTSLHHSLTYLRFRYRELPPGR